MTRRRDSGKSGGPAKSKKRARKKEPTTAKKPAETKARATARPSARSRKAGQPLEEYQRKRDFQKTPEPAAEGERRAAARKRRLFVVQKHAATRTHFDVRLEWGGALKSWAVPKGPSLDPKEKRLAVHVEDHPVEYAAFEGRIPKGEYGAGPVIIWDHGGYVPIYPSEDATDDEIEEAYRKGKVEFELFGERLRGKWGLIRIRGSAPADAAGKEPWLLIKKKDAQAAPDRDVVAEYRTSVVSGRTLDEVEEDGARGGRAAPPRAGSGAVAADAPDFQPMLAESSEQLPEADGWIFEEKIDGIRVIARAAPGEVRLLSRTGQRLERAFPEVAAAVARTSERAGAAFVLDGELAIRDAKGRPHFEEIQPRIHLKGAGEIEAWARRKPAELFIFDCLWANGLHFADRPLVERKAALAEILRYAGEGVHEVPWWEGEGDELWRRAQEEGWEGLVAKRRDSRYHSGRRSRKWVKLKLVRQEELAVVGWTDPEGGRAGFGALLLGYHDESGDLRYAGRVGTGFSGDDLRAISRELARLAREASPCVDPPDEAGLHWTEPRLVAVVKFQEWTRDGRLRAPVFLGLRHDKPAREVRIEARERKGTRADAGPPLSPQLDSLLIELERSESAGKTLQAEVEGVSLTFTNLDKTLWPEHGITKGELVRYYARVSPWLLPALAERPLHLERYPDGIDGERFWQQRAPQPVPEGIPTVEMEDEDDGPVERLVGGSLATLLYTAQLAAIPQHPWFSRVGSLDFADYAVLDLDPGDEVTFDVVRDVARWSRDELERLDLVGFVKTSGGRGLHVVLPLGPGVPYASARLLTQLVAALVARRHRARTTLERSKKKRAPDKVYLDCFQNEQGKTIASVYSVRPRPGAPVSTPLRWEELDADLDPQDFQIRDIWDRFQAVRDLWEPARTRWNRVEEVVERLEGGATGSRS